MKFKVDLPDRYWTSDGGVPELAGVGLIRGALFCFPLGSSEKAIMNKVRRLVRLVSAFLLGAAVDRFGQLAQRVFRRWRDQHALPVRPPIGFNARPKQ